MLLRNRSVIPLGLAAVVLLYEFFWKGLFIQPGTWPERLINITLFLLVGPVMAWWGQTVARSLLQKLARSEAASEEKSRLLEQRNRQLQIVLQASRAMTAVPGIKQVASVVVDQVVSYTRFRQALLIDGPDLRDTYELLASRGLSAPFLEQLMTGLGGPHRAASPVEWCRLTRQPVVVENLLKDFRMAGLREVYAMAGAQGLIGVPLVVQHKFRGALIVLVEDGGAITTAEISLVSALASQAALALENARLYAQNRTATGAMEQAAGPFLMGVAGAVGRTRVGVFPALHAMAQASAALLAPARAELSVTKGDRQAPLKVSEAVGIEEGQACYFAFTHPLILDHEVLGDLKILVPNQQRRLTEAEAQAAEAVAQLTVAVVGTASLLTEMRQTVDEVEGAYMGTLEALTKALEMRDHETEGHSRRVVQYTLALAQKMGVAEHELVPIIRGSLLHDIGKIGIPDAILKKSSALTESEWEVMRQHPLIGYEMLRGIGFLRQATPIILHHHERFDGTGYPHGLRGEAIPLGGRIFAVADAYDAITSDRPYRKGRGHEAAVSEIAAGAGSQFDPGVVAALLALPGEELARIRGSGGKAPVRQQQRGQA